MAVPTWLSVAVTMAKKAPSLATVLVLAGLIVWVAWTHSYSHAKADDVNREISTVKQDIVALKKDVDTIKTDGQKARREQLEGQMFQARVDQCKAENSTLKRLYAARLADLEVKYAEAGGGRYRLPECTDL